MRLCGCLRPLRATQQPERLRCGSCGHWTAHGRPPTVERVAALTREVTSLAGQLATDYAWAHSITYDPTRRGGPTTNGWGGSRGSHNDPTGTIVADDHRHPDGHPTGRLAVADYTIIAARLLERALRALRDADEAAGEALLAAETPGPSDHVRAPYHDPATLFPSRPDLAEAYAARDRRHSRGEGTPR